MHWFDIGLTIALIISTVWGFFRGFVRGLFSLLGLAAAVLLAVRAYPYLAPVLESFIAVPWVRQTVGFSLIGVAVMAVVMLCSTLLRLFLRAAGLSLADRLLGGLFGLAKVVLITSVLFIMANKFFPAERTQFEAGSVLAPLLSRSAAWLEAFLARHDDVIQQLYRQLPFPNSGDTAPAGQGDQVSRDSTRAPAHPAREGTQRR